MEIDHTDSAPNSIAKPDPAFRCAAFLVDVLVAMALFVVFSLIHPALGWLANSAYLLLRDGMNYPYLERRSLGKTLTQLRAVREDGSPTERANSILRNLPIALAGPIYAAEALGAGKYWAGLGGLSYLAMVIIVIEAILALATPTGRRLGDYLGRTLVKKD